MYQLSISIKVICHKMSSAVAEKRKKIFTVAVSVVAFSWFVLILLVPYLVGGEKEKMGVMASWLYDVIYVLLFIVYTAVMVHLLVTLGRLRSYFMQ